MTPLRRRRQFGRRRLQIGILNVFCFSAMFSTFQQWWQWCDNDDDDHDNDNEEGGWCDERVAQGQMETARPPLGLKGHTSLGSLCSVEKTPKSVNCLPTNKPTKLGTRSPIELL